MPMQTPMAPDPRQTASLKDRRGRLPLLALTGVLMLLIIGGVLWGSGMITHPVQTAISEPVYLRADNRPSDIGVVRPASAGPSTPSAR